tara:strand:+ start:1901 stop:2713 length:813 start_codon:yes stop_codon:yes gene_type:complete
MKVDNQNWYSLEIFGSESNREIFIAYMYDIVAGVTDNNNSSIIYFDKEHYEKVKTNIESDTLISDWKWSEIEEENWNKACTDFFQPIIISNEIQVLPSWDEPNNNYTNIIINPALAFGTGHHETTYMMIESMLSYDFKNKSVLDIGTGSGILSILAKKKGAKSIYAIDNDILTHNNFYENLDLNDISDIEFDVKDCFKIKNFEYDYILANINLNVLKKLIPNIVNKGTILIISGILNTDEQVVIRALEDGNKEIKNIFRKNEWLCFVVEL